MSKLLKQVFVVFLLCGIVSGAYMGVTRYYDRIYLQIERLQKNVIKLFSKPTKEFGFSRVAAGAFFSLALNSDGQVWVAGSNNLGQLGLGHRNDVEIWTNSLANIQDISAGHSHALALTFNGDLYGTGSNQSGELGLGEEKSTTQWCLLMSDVVAMAAGEHHSLALTSDGSLWAVGNNASGQLGLPQEVIVTINGKTVKLAKQQNKVKKWRLVLTDVSQVYAGREHSAVVRRDQSLWVAGDNRYGQYGLGDQRGTYRWQLAMGSVKKVARGFSDATMVIQQTPMEVLAVAKFQDTLRAFKLKAVKNGVLNLDWQEEAVAGQPVYTPAKTGDLLVTGWNWNFQLGQVSGNRQMNNGETGAEVIRSQLISWGKVLSEVSAVSTSMEHSLVIIKNGELWVAGSNGRGQLGLANKKEVRQWLKVRDKVRSAAAGPFHSLIVGQDGSLWVTGDNFHGQLGTGDKKDVRVWTKIVKLQKRDKISRMETLEAEPTEKKLASSDEIKTEELVPPASQAKTFTQEIQMERLEQTGTPNTF